MLQKSKDPESGDSPGRPGTGARAGRLAYGNFMFLTGLTFAGVLLTQNLFTGIVLSCWIYVLVPETMEPSAGLGGAVFAAQFLLLMTIGWLSRTLLRIHWLLSIVYFVYFAIILITFPSDGRS